MKRGMYLNRRTFIALALCAVLLGTAGGFAAAAGPKLPPLYRVAQYDVTCNNEVAGRLSVNTNAWTSVLNAHGLQPGTKYYFYCEGNFTAVGIETTDEKGDLHLQGTWPQVINVAEIPQMPPLKCVLTTTPLVGTNFGATLYAHYIYNDHLIAVRGTLRDNWNDRPLPGQKILVLLLSTKDQRYEPWALTYTDSDGTFLVEGDASSHDYPPNVWTVPDPEFNFCSPDCCVFENGGEQYNCVTTLAAEGFS